MGAARRVGRYTKYEITELTRMFGEGYSVYKICRNLNRSQNSIRNNLIRLGLIEGYTTPQRQNNSLKELEFNESIFSKLLVYFKYLIFLLILTFFLILKPNFNIIEVIISSIFIIIFN